MIELDDPPHEPVWWLSQNLRTGATFYTKAQSWYDARAQIGGNPMRVTDPSEIHRLNMHGKGCCK